jgi:hypothetical protein
VTVLTAALPHEYAGEQKGHGRLTEAITKVLPGGKDAPYDRERKIVHIYHLFPEILDRVSNASSHRQHPALFVPWTMPPLVVRQVKYTSRGDE